MSYFEQKAKIVEIDHLHDHSVLLGHNNESQKRLSGNQKAFPHNYCKH